MYYTYSQSKAMLRSWNMKGNKNRSPVATVLESERERRERGREEEGERRKRERHLTVSQVFRVKRNSEGHPVWLLHFSEDSQRLRDWPKETSGLASKQGLPPGLLPPGPVPFKRKGRQSLLYSLGVK